MQVCVFIRKSVEFVSEPEHIPPLTISLSISYIRFCTQCAQFACLLSIIFSMVLKRNETAGMKPNDMANKYECIEKCFECFLKTPVLACILWPGQRCWANVLALWWPPHLCSYSEWCTMEVAVRLRVITVVTAMHETRRDELVKWRLSFGHGATHTHRHPSASREILKMTYDLLWNFCLRC